MKLEKTIIQSTSKIKNFLTPDDIDICISLLTPYFDSIFETLKDKRIPYSISIINVDFSSIKKNIDKLRTFTPDLIDLLKKHNAIEFDTNFKILNLLLCSYATQSDILKNIEKTKHDITFFFGAEGLDCFKKGIRKSSNNIFLSPADMKNYSQKHHISDLEIVLKEYNKAYLIRSNNYCKFFERKSHQIFKTNINKIKNVIIENKKIKKHNLLINKPEDIFRDDLAEYLSNKIQASFSTEEYLPSKKRIDIFTEVENISFFLEIKWIGESLNNKGTGITTNYDNTALDGVKQTLEYIDELKNHTLRSVQLAYLVVFDARLDKKSINFNSYNYIKDKNLKKHLPCFATPQILHISNNHPK